MFSNQIAVSLNIFLDEKVSRILKDIQSTLQKHIHERRNYDVSPHLAIVTKFMSPEYAIKYADVIKNELKNFKKFEIEFTKFEPSSFGNYIFLNLTDESRNRILKLRDKVLTASKGIGNETPDGLPPRYQYDPHISIIKMDPLEREKALQLINQEYGKLKMLAQNLEVTMEQRDRNGFANFPKITNIELL